MNIITASWVEILQLVFAALGVGLSFWKLWIALENGLSITSTQSTDLRRVVAETQVLGELFRVFFQACLVAIGIISVLLPPPGSLVALPSEFELQSVLTRFGLITLTIAMALDSFLQEIRRRRFLADVQLVIKDVVLSPEQSMTADRLDHLEDVRSAKGIKAMGEALETANERRFQESQASIAKGTEAAHGAYKEANSVNIKIADLQEQLLARKHEERIDDRPDLASAHVDDPGGVVPAPGADVVERSGG